MISWLIWTMLLFGPKPVDQAQFPDARFVLDLHDKKIEDVLTMYTADAVFVDPDGHEFSGAGLRKLYEQVTQTLDSDLHLSRETMQQKGDTAVESGSYTETLRHRDSGKVDHVGGKYRFAVRREPDGAWRYTRMEWH